ncbi:MAG: DNA-directed polymerase subunit omega [Clostridia bacterium]|jgi:DNA-directed RNA polymerase subunit omega|nr:DNA-directed polymerase subunit omega [Clostridia bacterium]MDN5322259.1 DNA-directed polymerase subunit omega [Clostridia bacterium]
MIKPSIDVLVSKVDSKYSLVVAAAKRARSIVEGAPVLAETDSTKPVTRALFEIAAGKITYERTKTGIK